MRKQSTKILFLTALLFLAAQTMAQPPMPPPGPPGPDSGPMRQRIRERIETMKIWKLTDAVGLTTEQSEKFFPMYNKHQKALESIEDQRVDLVNQLDSLSNDPKSSDQKIIGLIAQLQEIPVQISAERERFQKEISTILSTRQQAKLIVFEEQFRQQIQDFVRQVRRQYGGGHRGDE